MKFDKAAMKYRLEHPEKFKFQIFFGTHVEEVDQNWCIIKLMHLQVQC